MATKQDSGPAAVPSAVSTLGTTANTPDPRTPEQTDAALAQQLEQYRIPRYFTLARLLRAFELTEDDFDRAPNKAECMQLELVEVVPAVKFLHGNLMDGHKDAAERNDPEMFPILTAGVALDSFRAGYALAVAELTGKVAA